MFKANFRLLENSVEEMVCFQAALKDAAAMVNAEFAKSGTEVFVGLEGR